LAETETIDRNERSPEEWRDFLLPRLVEQASAVQLYRDYYKGIHRIAYATQRFKDIFGRFFPAAADNWMKVIVDSPTERLTVQGFKFGGPDAPADDAAWQLWQRNKFDLRSKTLFTESGKCGVAFILVDNTANPTRLTIESPLEVYVHVDPETDERAAAVKRWIGDDKYAYCIVYLPHRVVRYRSRGKVRSLTGRPTWDQQDSVPNTFEKVPMIPVENLPDIHDGGISDLEDVIPIQDRVNKLCLDLDVGSEFHAAPQRWATGWEAPTDANGRPLPDTQIKAATSRFLAFKEPDTKVGQLPAGDPGAYVDPIEMYVQHMAAISHTPPHYLLGRMVNMAGDALKVAETGLVAKCLSKQIAFDDPLEEAIAMAMGKSGDEADSAEVIWQNPESRTFGQLVDGVVKLRQEVALPLEMAWEMIGLSPQQIARAKKLIGLPERDFRALDQGLALQQRAAAERERLGQQAPDNNQEPGATPDPAMNGGRNA
jgi:hypothetical protein